MGEENEENTQAAPMYHMREMGDLDGTDIIAGILCESGVGE